MPGRDSRGPMGQGPEGFRGRNAGRCVGPDKLLGHLGRNSTWRVSGRGFNRRQRFFRNCDEPLAADMPDTETNNESAQLNNEIQAIKQAISDLTAIVRQNLPQAAEQAK
ncbi:MAG: DUF5320 domain-containing protein [Candidatus Rifleibacteriota bacterium]